MFKLKGIARRAKKRAVMEELDACDITTDQGVVGDFRGKPGKRQVTVLSEADWEKACSIIGTQLPWTARRANLLVSDIQFDASSVGKKIQIGELELQITKETVPCYRMDEAHDGMQDALMAHWRGGVCCQVLQSGHVQHGDEVLFLDE